MASFKSAKELNGEYDGPPCAIDLVEIDQVALWVLRRPVIKSAGEPFLSAR